MQMNMRFAAVAAISLAAACVAPVDRKGREATVARSAVAAESAEAAIAATLPVTGRWDEPHLVERLVRAGLAPQALAVEKAEAYWGVPVVAFRVGRATLHAFIYSDSIARHRVTDGLDSTAVAPKGIVSSYALPRLLILQDNLAAVLVGGTEQQQERVALALSAGLPRP